MNMNEFAMIAGIFAIGILIIGFASWGLYNQVVNLEGQNNDLNINYSTTKIILEDVNTQRNDLLQTVDERNTQIEQLNTQISTISSDRDVAVNNYNASEAELAEQRVLMEQTMLDNNRLIDDWNAFEDYFDEEFDLNVFDDNFSIQLEDKIIDQNEYDWLKDFFFDLRNDFGQCYWAVNCVNDSNGCNAAYDGPDLNALILQTIFAAACENISDADYNAYAAFE